MEDMPNNPQDRDEAAISQWPKVKDPLEERIVETIKAELLRTDKARGIFNETGNLQLEHLKTSLKNLDNPQFIHDYTQKVLDRLSTITNSRIVEGQENLEQLTKGQPILLLTNHLGVYKLNSWPIEKLREKTGLTGAIQPLFYPFPLYYSAMYPIAKRLEDNLYIASFEYPGQLGKVFRATASIEVPPKDILPKGQSRTEVLIDSTRKLVETHPNAVIVSYPEGGTTGKRNNGGPYDVEKFHTGSYVIAKELGITVLPVAQYFDVQEGFELRVFKPINLGTNATDQELADAANESYQEELVWLKEKNQSK